MFTNEVKLYKYGIFFHILFILRYELFYINNNSLPYFFTKITKLPTSTRSLGFVVVVWGGGGGVKALFIYICCW